MTRLQKFTGTAAALAAMLCFVTCNVSPDLPPAPTWFALTVSSNPAAGGTVTPKPAGGSYTSGTTVKLTAAAASGYQFVNWSGDASGTQATVSITIDEAKNVIANFATLPPAYALNATVSPAEGGTVTLNPPGGSYDSGATVTVTATPANGFALDNWSGDASGSSPAVAITMTAAKTVIAHFVKADFLFQAKSLPLPGFEDTIDAVTKASDVLDTLYLRVDSLPGSDSLTSVVIKWGDLTADKTIPAARFPVGKDFVIIEHWYTRDADTVNGYCTTTATATSGSGIVKDTTIRIKVLRKTDHL
jgi:uncharacterized repeat protein (TIGR02543 family)